MSLTKELKSQSIVIVAENFNPSIFNQYWLVNSGFVKEDQIKNYIFSNEVVQFFTDDYKFLVAQNQLQFVLMNPSKDFFLVLEDFLIKVIDKLKEIPYKAIGVNFDWIIKDNELSTKELTKRFFFKENSEFYNQFSDDKESRFGSYLSTDFEKSRMKVDIKPVFLDDARTEEVLNISFNFHIELKNQDDVHQNLLEYLREWNKYSSKSESIISKLN